MDNIQKFLFQIATLGAREDHELIKKYESDADSWMKLATEHLLQDACYSVDHVLDRNHHHYEERKRIRQEQLSEFETLMSQIVEQHHIPVLLVKGHALREDYDSSCIRQASDFDLVVEKVDDFWSLVEILLKNGYDYQYSPVFLNNQDKTYGVSKFEKPLSVCNIYLEVNIGSFPISPITFMTDSLFERPRTTRFGEVHVPIPSIEQSIVVLISETIGNPNFRVRDAVDYHFLTLKNKDQINTKLLYQLLEENKLLRWYQNFLTYYQMVSNQDGITLTPFLKKNKNLEQRPIRKWMKHLYPFLRNHHSLSTTFTKLFYHFLTEVGDRYLSKSNSTWMLACIQSLLPVKKRHQLGLQSHFIPLGQTDSQLAFGWVEISGKLLMSSPVGWFFPSCFCLESEEELQEIWDYLQNVDINKLGVRNFAH